MGKAKEDTDGVTSYIPPTDTVVDTSKVAAKKNVISVKGRYCTTRPLSADYKVEKKVLGSGMSGPVQLAIGKADGRKYAVKSFIKTGSTASKRMQLKNEVEVYLALDHPHVAQLEMVFETEAEVFIVMEFMAGGELYDRLAEQKYYTEQVASSTTYQMLLAVAYMHAHGVTHRDLKLENFLYETKEADHLKLIDFGFAKFRRGTSKMSQACGTLHYVAPEVLAKAYTEKADCWALGIIVYMLLTGGSPFSGNDDEVLQKIKTGKPQFAACFNLLSDDAQDFVKNLLVDEPDKRMSAEQALDHRFIKNRIEKQIPIRDGTLRVLRSFAHASHFRRATYAMMAWSLTVEQQTELRSIFVTLDIDKTGTIKHSQVKQTLMDRFHIDNVEAEELFKSLDTDSDNEIAYSEFLAAIVCDRLSMHEDVLRKAFFRFDKDQSGTISKEDLMNVLGKQFEGVDIDDLVTEVDTNKDGFLSYAEFLDYFQKEIVSPATQAHVEKLSSVLDGLIPEHANPQSLTVHAAKAPLMRNKETSSLGKSRSPLICLFPCLTACLPSKPARNR